MATATRDVPPEESAGSLLIDVLPREHYSRCHIPGARNACVYEVTFLDQVREVCSDLDARILLYGARGETMEAEVAADKLVRAGYRNVRILRGGLQAWQAAGRPVEGDGGRASEDEDRPSLIDGEYRADLEQSTIGWTGRNPNGKHWGTLSLASGAFRVRDGTVSGRFEVDLRSMVNLDLAGDELQPVLIRHLLSDDFFYAERFPVALFNLGEARPITGAAATVPNVRVSGELEMRGIRAPLAFDATLSGGATGELVVEAHFDLDRTRWGVVYGSSRFFAHLGMHLVYDLISLELRLVLGQQA